MKLIIITCLAIITLFTSCKELEVEPESKPVTINYADYSLKIDSTYFKLWSDSTWEKFGRTITIAGITYNSIINSEGIEYFYNGKSDYAGFKNPGDSLLIFKDPLTIPTQVDLNEVYTSLSTFQYQNITYTIRIKQTFADTVTVSIKSGNFYGCIWIKSSTEISANGNSQNVNKHSWIAKGPFEINKVIDFGEEVYMLKCVIDGKEWGLN